MTAGNTLDIDDLRRQIKRNCDISDARFWGYYSVCGLLMRMRDLFRCENDLLPWHPIPKEEIYPWLDGHDELWRVLETAELQTLDINGTVYDPFDNWPINKALSAHGLCYSGGYGAFRKPAFFLAHLDSVRELYDYQIHYLGREICRDLAAYPAMLQGRCIFVRREIVRTLLWERLHDAAQTKCSSLHHEIEKRLGFSSQEPESASFPSGMERLVHDVAEIFLLHELGEALEDDQSAEWQEIICAPHAKLEELYLRGVTDLLADMSEHGTIKGLLDRGDKLLLDLYPLFVDGIRRELFPAFSEACRVFSETGDFRIIGNARLEGYERASHMKALISRFWRERGTLKGINEELKKGSIT